MILNMAVGPQGLLTPGGPSMRGSYDGAVVTQDMHARYQEAVYRGRVYCAAQTTGTTVPAGLSASPTTTTIFNPLGSGVNAVIWYASITFTVAFAAASAIWLAMAVQGAGAATTGTAGLVTNQLTGAPFGGLVKPLTTATIAAAPTQLVMAIGLGNAGAITLQPQISPMGGWMDGIITVAPGNTLCFAGSTAGGAAGAFACFIYEEVPINQG